MSLRYSAMKNGHGSYGVYDHVQGGWLRMFVGSYDLAQAMIARIGGELEPEEYPAQEREAGRADQFNDERRDGVR